MGNMTISVKDDTENFWRRYAKAKYGETKGSLGKAAEDAFGMLCGSDEEERLRRRAIQILEKGYDISFRGWKKRSDLYASRLGRNRH